VAQALYWEIDIKAMGAAIAFNKTACSTSMQNLRERNCNAIAKALYSKVLHTVT